MTTATNTDSNLNTTNTTQEDNMTTADRFDFETPITANSTTLSTSYNGIKMLITAHSTEHYDVKSDGSKSYHSITVAVDEKTIDQLREVLYEMSRHLAIERAVEAERQKRNAEMVFDLPTPQADDAAIWDIADADTGEILVNPEVWEHLEELTIEQARAYCKHAGLTIIDENDDHVTVYVREAKEDTKEDTKWLSPAALLADARCGQRNVTLTKSQRETLEFLATWPQVGQSECKIEIAQWADFDDTLYVTIDQREDDAWSVKYTDTLRSASFILGKRGGIQSGRIYRNGASSVSNPSGEIKRFYSRRELHMVASMLGVTLHDGERPNWCNYIAQARSAAAMKEQS